MFSIYNIIALLDATIVNVTLGENIILDVVVLVYIKLKQNIYNEAPFKIITRGL